MAIPILSLIVLIPLLFAVLTLLTKTKEQARVFALFSSVVVLALSMFTYFNFDSTTSQMQFQEFAQWVPSLGINYQLGIDGISMPLVLLNAIVIPLLILFTWNDDKKQPNRFYALILATQGAVIGVFLALDFFLFYVFWELTLVPLFFMVSIWGGPGKHKASIKFFIYTHVGSLVMLLGIFGLYFAAWKQTGTPNMGIEHLLSQFQFIASGVSRDLIFVALLFGFLVKIPAFPFHSWLPDAYVEAPTAGSVLFVLLKIGGYGLFRVILPILPFTPSMNLMIAIMAALGAVSILYGAFLALAQKDLKRMVAYSSVSHMGYVTLGAAGVVSLSVSGAMFQQFSHGLIMSIMFMACGVINNATGTRIINELGGLARKMPKLAVIMMLAFMASLGLPWLTGFIAEFLVLTFTYINQPTYVIIAILAIIITAAYHLWAMQRTMFGVYNEKFGALKDISASQTFSMAVIAILILYFGLNPSPVLDMMITNSEKLVSLMAVVGV
ncbi:proton-translocating NADH-quinone oxidoreductase, chain M [Methanomethylovorans hollandica DSM 15978]|uniref:Proton-translocating NADH-quinone oxidoreductase, chain M n=1 Tax=Methanomethylovorans hollandica (strain DSM 15978 / NBRC 107637 / DMS1) TaxID=867904 RepID=L0KWZ5_METHD|nr:F(420)H(2) dehydrogenase subunit M [Methanomethylovorans hollandica]AGB49651.1 proton-translocating NADH-quinone oxidoreductase, chain M [Methanomethylovorans hollandica DSM 15978]